MTETSNYTLSKEGVCWRTTVAVRAQTLSPSDWVAFVNGQKGTVAEDEAVRAEHAFLCRNILEALCFTASSALPALGRMDSKQLDARQSTIIKKRWLQIQMMVRGVIVKEIVEPIRSKTLDSLDHREE